MSIKRTELVFILDRSGSMSGLESDTIGGFNSLLEKQKKEPGEATVTTVLFDDKYELLHDRIDVKAIGPITDQEYYVRGCTALLDAMGRTIHKIADAQKHTLPEHRADKVLFVIITDGYENASREYRADQIKALVEREQKEYGWEFLFLGANIDAIAAARDVGISADRAVEYRSDSTGTQVSYDAVCCTVSALRQTGAITGGWKQSIEMDRRSRK